VAIHAQDIQYKIIKLYCNLLNITVTNRAVFAMYLHISCKQIKTENNKKKACACYIPLTLFLSSAYQSLIPSAYTTHVVGKNADFFLLLPFLTLPKEKDVTSNTDEGDTDSDAGTVFVLMHRDACMRLSQICRQAANPLLVQIQIFISRVKSLSL